MLIQRVTRGQYRNAVASGQRGASGLDDGILKSEQYVMFEADPTLPRYGTDLIIRLIRGSPLDRAAPWRSASLVNTSRVYAQCVKSPKRAVATSLS